MENENREAILVVWGVGMGPVWWSTLPPPPLPQGMGVERGWTVAWCIFVAPHCPFMNSCQFTRPDPSPFPGGYWSTCCHYRSRCILGRVICMESSVRLFVPKHFIFCCYCKHYLFRFNVWLLPLYRNKIEMYMASLYLSALLNSLPSSSSLFVTATGFSLQLWHLWIKIDLLHFLLLNELYYIYSCTVIITTQFYSISIPNHQGIAPPPNLSHLENKFFKVCESVTVLQRSSVCPFFRFRM